jgi:hypothetical protein
MTFQNIRDASSPETYSWTVNMSSDQTLKLVNDQLAGVFTDERENFAIVAEAAHDAIGTAVPTTLSVSGNVLTLTVHHRAGNPAAGGAPFTYPVIQGVGWEGGFQVYTEKLPPTEQEEEIWGGWGYVSPPEAVTPSEDPEATASSAYRDGPKRHFIWVLCSHGVHFAPGGVPLSTVPDGSGEWERDCGNPWAEDPGVEVVFFEAMHGKFIQQKGPLHSDFFVWHEGDQHAAIGCLAGGFGAKKEEPGGTFRRGNVIDCVWWGTTKDSRPKYATWGEHITPVLHADAEERSSCGDNCNGTPNPWIWHHMPPMAYYLWADGHYAKHVTDCIDCN